MSKNQQLATTEQNAQYQITAFSNETAFEAAQRMAKALCASPLVPEIYQGAQNIGSAVIALEIAQRLGASPLMVMQNLNVIHGRPSWSSQFIIAALNSCGRFSPLRFEVTGEGDQRQCVAWAYDRSTNDRLDGPAVSIAMAKKEGWYGKNGSKWQTLPDLMLRYRSASFFGKLYAPEVLMGIQSQEETVEIDAPISGIKPASVGTHLRVVDAETISAGSDPEPAPATKIPSESVLQEQEPGRAEAAIPRQRRAQRTASPAPSPEPEVDHTTRRIDDPEPNAVQHTLSISTPGASMTPWNDKLLAKIKEEGKDEAEFTAFLVGKHFLRQGETLQDLTEAKAKAVYEGCYGKQE